MSGSLCHEPVLFPFIPHQHSLTAYDSISLLLFAVFGLSFQLTFHTTCPLFFDLIRLHMPCCIGSSLLSGRIKKGKQRAASKWWWW